MDPLLLAPLSEIFGRQLILHTNLAPFTILQISTLIAPIIASFITLRTLSRLFENVDAANGRGSTCHMLETHERAVVCFCCLIVHMLAPTFDPFMRAMVIWKMNEWR